MLSLAKKLNQVTPSKTLAITALAKSLVSQGKHVIGFGAGEPDFDTFTAIKEAAKKAIDDGFTKYTPENGTFDLRQAICDKFERDNKIKYTPNQIVVSNGAKHSLFNIFQAICNPSDEVIIIAPYWLSYPEMVRLSGAKVKIVKTTEETNFKASVDQIKMAVTPKTKALVLNSPSNPTGVIYTRKEIENIAELAAAKKFYVISDEIYEKLVYDNSEHVSIASLGKDIYEQVITVNGMSKAYSMTGWRIGYLGAKEELVKAISMVQSHSTSNPCSISQKAALAALKMDENEIINMRETFRKRRNLMMSLLDHINKITYVKPDGAFYIYCNISKTKMKAQDFAAKILEEKLVALVPGESFGSDKHIRLSFATSEANIKEGMDRIKQWVGR